MTINGRGDELSVGEALVITMFVELLTISGGNIIDAILLVLVHVFIVEI